MALSAGVHQPIVLDDACEVTLIDAGRIEAQATAKGICIPVADGETSERVAADGRSLALLSFPSAHVIHTERIDRFLMPFPGSKGRHHLIALILHVMTVQIVVHLHLPVLLHLLT